MFKKHTGCGGGLAKSIIGICCIISLCLVISINAAAQEQEETEDVPVLVLGTPMPEDHQEIETLACFSCHRVEADAETAATELYLKREGILPKAELWEDIAAFYGKRQTCTLATTHTRSGFLLFTRAEPWVTTVDFALDPENKVFYALSEIGTRKLLQMRKNAAVAVEYHNTQEARKKLFRCLQMRGRATVLEPEDPEFDKGLEIFNPSIDVETVKRGMLMTRFVPEEILFYDLLRYKKGLNIYQRWTR